VLNAGIGNKTNLMVEYPLFCVKEKEKERKN
jgi:hypothetical protein